MLYISEHISVLCFFLLLNSVLLHGYATLWLSVHSQADEHLGCFQFLALKNNVALNTHVQLFVHTFVFISLGVKLWDLMLGLTVVELFRN